MRRAVFIFCLCACGDDDVTMTPDGGRTDAGVRDDDAGGGSPDGGIADGGTDAGALPSCDPARLFVTTSDYVTGRIGTIDLDGFAVEVSTADSPDQDSSPDGRGCDAFMLERALGRVRVVSDDPLATGRVLDVNLPGRPMMYAANPSRVIAVAADKAYVVLQGRNEIAIFDPSAASPAITDTIDLSMFHDADDIDGSIDAMNAMLVNGVIYVVAGRYWFDDAFAQHFEGSVLIGIDIATDTVVDFDTAEAGVQPIDLEGENPWRGMHLREDGMLLLGSTGDSFAIDGGIELVDLTAGESLGFVLEEETLGDEINGFVPDGADAFYVIEGMNLVHVDGEETTLVREGTDGVFATDTALVSWSRDADPGIRVHSLADGTELTTEPIEVGDLPIYGVALIH
jgi:hypothetical protein